jgi:hypothetical protein
MGWKVGILPTMPGVLVVDQVNPDQMVRNTPEGQECCMAHEHQERRIVGRRPKVSGHQVL